MCKRNVKVGMRRRKISEKFDIVHLDTLASDEGSCVHVQKLQHHLGLHPFHLNDLNNSVKDILNKDIAKYSAKLDGILFGYKNIKFLSDLGEICDDSCFIHIDVEAEFFIFKPTEGKTLQGVVNKKSKDHVGCLVHKIFNVALPKPKHSSDWLGHTANLNSEILFTITHTNFEGKLPYIRGEIVSILSNPQEVDLPVGDKEDGKKKKMKVSRKLKFEDETFEEEPKKSRKRKKSISESDLDQLPSKKKKKKKQADEEQFSELIFGNEEETPKVKKSKSPKKQNVENPDEEHFSELIFGDEEKTPKVKKSKSPKKQNVENVDEEQFSELIFGETSKVKKSKSPKKQNVENTEEMEKETSTSKKEKKRRKSFLEFDTDEKSKESVVNEESISKKGKKRKQSISEADVDEVSPRKKKKKKSEDDEELLGQHLLELLRN